MEFTNNMVAILITILLGALVGWAASKVMRRDGEQGLLGDIIVGILGAFVGGLISSLFDADSGVNFAISLTVADILWAFIGALIVSGVWNLLTRRTVR